MSKKKGRIEVIELPSGVVIRSAPRWLCLDALGGVINHSERTFYNLDDVRDRRALAKQVIEAWKKWVRTGE